jgi:hypothetical protein
MKEKIGLTSSPQTFWTGKRLPQLSEQANWGMFRELSPLSVRREARRIAPGALLAYELALLTSQFARLMLARRLVACK